MTKEMHRLITIFIIGFTIMIPVNGQTVPVGLVEALSKGDAGSLAEFFHQSLEMTILEKDYQSSKNQATRIMENFFKENTPTGFTISFEGAKEKSKYAIGALTTADATFRVNMFFLNKENRRLIYYLSIEKESQYELHPGP
ncbi:MAG: DUF4783 domain-containing protein [Bacteroidales bacterium]|nr:DUF4783 domain-containing protein [Bacteroidales bacterium]